MQKNIYWQQLSWYVEMRATYGSPQEIAVQRTLNSILRKVRQHYIEKLIGPQVRDAAIPLFPNLCKIGLNIFDTKTAGVANASAIHSCAMMQVL